MDVFLHLSFANILLNLAVCTQISCALASSSFLYILASLFRSFSLSQSCAPAFTLMLESARVLLGIICGLPALDRLQTQYYVPLCLYWLILTSHVSLSLPHPALPVLSRLCPWPRCTGPAPSLRSRRLPCSVAVSSCTWTCKLASGSRILRVARAASKSPAKSCPTVRRYGPERCKGK